ncbi:MAG: cyclic nucleotide-binding domain-containing protein [Candidatus Methylacidiphilales bacterium]|nr:cyclic nucleotide-binding domain-containing protein [Candidatus Methylacidiphilales bacterium]
MVTVPMESKLGQGEALSCDRLLGFLPALGEVPKGVFTKFAEGAASVRHFKAGDLVCREGDFGSTAFYIVSGSVDIFIASPQAHITTSLQTGGFFGRTIARMKSALRPETNDGRKDTPPRRRWIPVDASVDLAVGSPIAQLGAGELFGEMTCRTFQPRSATVRAREDCVMVEMLRVVLDMLVGTRDIMEEIKSTTKVKAPTFKGTSFKAELDKKYRERALLNHIRNVPIFESLDESFVQQLCARAGLQTFYKGQVICRENDPADRFYLIRQGMVKVSQGMPGGEMVLTYLSRGDYFGEIGLVRRLPRTATCTATDTVDLVVIGADDFHAMLAAYPSVAQTIEAVVDQRLAPSSRERPASLPASSTLREALDLGLLQAQNLLLIDLEKCTRCDLCVQACAEAHEGVTRLLRDGTRYQNYLVATACRSCQDPLCMTQCPVGSIRRKESLEIVIEDWCIGCTKCAELCPYGNITMHPIEWKLDKAETANKKPETPPATATPAAKKPAATSKATTCDLCTDLATPSCVYACPHDAAMRVNPVDFFSRRMPGLSGLLMGEKKPIQRAHFRTTH